MLVVQFIVSLTSSSIFAVSSTYFKGKTLSWQPPRLYRLLCSRSATRCLLTSTRPKPQRPGGHRILYGASWLERVLQLWSPLRTPLTSHGVLVCSESYNCLRFQWHGFWKDAACDGVQNKVRRSGGYCDRRRSQCSTTAKLWKARALI